MHLSDGVGTHPHSPTCLKPVCSKQFTASGVHTPSVREKCIRYLIWADLDQINFFSELSPKHLFRVGTFLSPRLCNAVHFQFLHGKGWSLITITLRHAIAFLKSGKTDQLLSALQLYILAARCQSSFTGLLITHAKGTRGTDCKNFR